MELLKCPVVKEHANRYVTSVMDLLYEPEGLLAMQMVDVPKGERYFLWKGGYRSWLISPTLIIVCSRGLAK